jgi:hypothetical protein
VGGVTSDGATLPKGIASGEQSFVLLWVLSV